MLQGGTIIGPIHHQGKWGFLSKDGEFVIPPIYESLGNCREDRIGFVADGKMGFLNSAGEVVIPPEFEPEPYVVPHFSEGLCAVRLGGKVGYIEPTGAWAIQPRFLYGWDFRGGKSLAQAFGKPMDKDYYYCSIDRSGTELARLEVYEIALHPDYPESLDRFPVLMHNASHTTLLVRWIDWRGTVVFAERYADMTNWCEDVAGFCPVEDWHPWGLVKSSGEVIVEPKFYLLDEFAEGLARAALNSKQFGFINPQGEWVIEPKYRHAQRFSEGLAFVTINGKDGCINTKGEMVIDPRFSSASGFDQGHAQVEYDGKNAVIDNTGHVIWETVLVRK